MPAMTRQAYSSVRGSMDEAVAGSRSSSSVWWAARRAASRSAPSAGSAEGSVVSSTRTHAKSTGLWLASRATASACAGSSGMERLPARTLPVPTGMMPMRTPDPAMPAATARTVPSPPAAMTMDAPSLRARTACPVPGSSRVVSRQCTWSMPSSLALRLMRSLKACGSSCFEGFMMIHGRGLPRSGSSAVAGMESACRLR